MLISVTELRQGTTFQDQEKVYQVLQYDHIKKARGNATIKVKVKDLKNGSVVEKTYLSGQKVTEANLSKLKAQFLYQDKEGFHFMESESYEQFLLPGQVIKAEAPYLTEGVELELLSLGDEVIALSLPHKVTLEVLEASPGIKGDSATNVFKEVRVANGLKVKVPLFIAQGDKVVIDTRTGEYVERV